MIEIKKKFINEGEEVACFMLEDLSKNASVAWQKDMDNFNKIKSECKLTDDELLAIMNGGIQDISLRQYCLINAYIKSLIENVPESSINQCKDAKPSDNCCGGACENCDSVGNFCENYDKCEHKQDTEDENDILKSEADSPDEKFIDNVNSTLEQKLQINKEEAINAKKQFDEDVNKYAASDYDNTAKKANVELFGTERDLNSMTMSELKYLLYKNHWDKEFDLNSINHRQTLLSFLYHKLEDRIIDKIHKKNNINKDLFDRFKNMYKEKYEHEYEGNAVKEILDVLDDINKMLG